MRRESAWAGERACDEGAGGGRACVGWTWEGACVEWGGGRAKAREACRVWELDGLCRGGDLH